MSLRVCDTNTVIEISKENVPLKGDLSLAWGVMLAKLLQWNRNSEAFGMFLAKSQQKTQFLTYMKEGVVDDSQWQPTPHCPGGECCRLAWDQQGGMGLSPLQGEPPEGHQR